MEIEEQPSPTFEADLQEPAPADESGLERVGPVQELTDEVSTAEFLRASLEKEEAAGSIAYGVIVMVKKSGEHRISICRLDRIGAASVLANAAAAILPEPPNPNPPETERPRIIAPRPTLLVPH